MGVFHEPVGYEYDNSFKNYLSVLCQYSSCQLLFIWTHIKRTNNPDFFELHQVWKLYKGTLVPFTDNRLNIYDIKNMMQSLYPGCDISHSHPGLIMEE